MRCDRVLGKPCVGTRHIQVQFEHAFPFLQIEGNLLVSFKYYTLKQ